MKLFMYCFLIFAFCSFCQAENIKIVKTVSEKVNFFTTDILGNVYVVKGNELTKYNSNGEKINTYSNSSLSSIVFVDASNPLKILLFYKDFSQIVFLDNTLTLNGSPILLDKFQLVQTLLSCSSHDNGIWLFDQLTFQLVRLNQGLKKSYQSGNLNQLLNIPLAPTYLIEHNNWLYMSNPQTGILVFDIYGTYYKNIPLKNISTFQIKDDYLYYCMDSKLYRYHLILQREEEVKFNLLLAKNIRIEKDRIYVLKEDEWSIYSFN